MKKIQNALAKTKIKKLSNQACFLGTRKSKKKKGYQHSSNMFQSKYYLQLFLLSKFKSMASLTLHGSFS